MRLLLLLAFLGNLLCASSSAEVITNGLPMVVTGKSMEAAGYKKTQLATAPRIPNEDLQFWHVDQGVLIFTYSSVSKRIVGLSYILSDERPRATRKTFSFDVTSFDTTTGLMTIRTTKGEPDGAANGSQPSRPDTNRTSQAAGSRR
jgi:hypothetical protein